MEIKLCCQQATVPEEVRKRHMTPLLNDYHFLCVLFVLGYMVIRESTNIPPQPEWSHHHLIDDELHSEQ